MPRPPEIAPFVCDTAALLNKALTEGKSIVFEGAQGTMLDIDHGTYPFVTSSSATSGGAVIGTGVAPTAIDMVIGVTKAYCTRVGGGPFPTEALNDKGDLLRARGNEYGAVTGRRGVAGWLDLPLLRYAGMINGICGWWLQSWTYSTNFEIPVCVGYKINGKKTDEIPAQASGYDKIGASTKISLAGEHPRKRITAMEKLPKPARAT
jgi:adenylosuccinate synthase